MALTVTDPSWPCTSRSTAKNKSLVISRNQWGKPYLPYALGGFLSLLLHWGLIRSTEAHQICYFYEATRIKFSLRKWKKSLATSNNGVWIRVWGQRGTAQFQCHFEIYDSRWQKKNMQWYVFPFSFSSILSTVQKFCQRGFIWMVTPKEFEWQCV